MDAAYPNPIRVLIVDDHPLVRRGLTSLLNGTTDIKVVGAASDGEEAIAYAAHPVLGSRLRECTGFVLQVGDKSVEQIFGYPDNLKFRSSMTLFAQTAEDNQVFVDAMKKYFAGALDPQTLARL